MAKRKFKRYPRQSVMAVRPLYQTRRYQRLIAEGKTPSEAERLILQGRSSKEKVPSRQNESRTLEWHGVRVKVADGTRPTRRQRRQITNTSKCKTCGGRAPVGKAQCRPCKKRASESES